MYFSIAFGNYVHNFNFEDERGVGRDEAVANILVAIREFGWAGKYGFCSNMETLEALVPSFDHLTGTNYELNGFISVMAAVKF